VIFFVGISVGIIWVQEVKLETSAILTIINGITTAVSLIVAALGVLLTLSVSNELIVIKNDYEILGLILGSLLLPILLLQLTYIFLFANEATLAIKVDLTALTVVTDIFAYVLFFITHRIRINSMKRKTDK